MYLHPNNTEMGTKPRRQCTRPQIFCPSTPAFAAHSIGPQARRYGIRIYTPAPDRLPPLPWKINYTHFMYIQKTCVRRPKSKTHLVR